MQPDVTLGEDLGHPIAFKGRSDTANLPEATSEQPSRRLTSRGKPAPSWEEVQQPAETSAPALLLGPYPSPLSQASQNLGPAPPLSLRPQSVDASAPEMVAALPPTSSLYMEDTSRVADVPLSSESGVEDNIWRMKRVYRRWQRRRRARPAVAEQPIPVTSPAIPQTIHFAPARYPPPPPSSSFGGSNSSAATIHPTALSSSPDIALVVHQTKALHPGDEFSLSLNMSNINTASPSTVSLSFSAHAINRTIGPRGDVTTTHHTLFKWRDRISLPETSSDTDLSLPFSLTVPRQAKCETCSRLCESLPPSLRVEDHQRQLIARISYELVATWGDQAAVAEVKVARPRGLLESSSSRGKWVKLADEVDMRGAWQGWEMTRVELSYQFPPSISSSTSDLLFELKADLQLLPLSSGNPVRLHDILPRLSAEHSHLILYELIRDDAKRLHIKRAWSSSTAQYDLQAEVKTYEEGSQRGAKVRRGFRLEALPIASFAPFTTCAGWQVEYRFELILGQLDRDARPIDHFQFSAPLLLQKTVTTTITGPAPGVPVGQKRRSGVRRWFARRARGFWRFIRCTCGH